MPVNLQQLKKVKKEHFFYIDGVETPENLINFVYKPNEFTPELEDKLSNLSDGEKPTDSFLLMVCEVVVSWDVEDEIEEEIVNEDGKGHSEIKRIPIAFNKRDLTSLKKIPTEIFRQLFTAIMEDIRQKKDQATELQIG